MRFTGKTKYGLRAILAFSFCLLFISPSIANEKTWKLRYAHVGPPGGPANTALQWWASEIQKQTKGRVEFEFFWSQSLVKGKNIIKAVGSGLADAGFLMGVYSPAEFPVWNAANAPFNGDDRWVGMRTWQELHNTSDLLRAEAEKKNVKVVAAFTPGPMNILSKSPILSIEDLKGKKIRSTGGWSTLLKNLGATPVRLGIGETYQALDKGAVDGTINYTEVIYNYKHYEVADHVVEIKMGMPLGLAHGINLKLFNSMPEDIQTVILDVSDKLVDRIAQDVNAAEAQLKTAMIEGIDNKKVVFHQMDPAEREKWQRASGFFIENWNKKVKKLGIDGEKFMELVSTTRSKYEAELSKQGYPWER